MTSCKGECQTSTCNDTLYKCEKYGEVGCKIMAVVGCIETYCTNDIGQPDKPASNRCGRCGGNLKPL